MPTLERLAMIVLVLLGLAVLVNNLMGCSAGPQIPVQAPPTTVSTEVTIHCGHEPDAGGETTPERTSGGCSSSIWVDTSTAADQTTRGIETGPVDVSPTTDVGLSPTP